MRYSKEEVEIIKKMRGAGATIAAIAAYLGRPVNAIAQKVRYNGIQRQVAKRCGKIVATRIDERLFDQWTNLLFRRNTSSYALLQSLIEREIDNDPHSDKRTS